MTDKGSGTYTFKMPASKVTVEATFTQIATEPETLPFTDVKTGDWFYEAVQYVYDKGMMTGVSADRFAPASTTTRGMIVTILYRLENEPAVSGGSAFTDVENGAWYADAVAWAAANDIVNGTSATTFSPNGTMTRAMLVTALWRLEGEPAAAGTSGFPDVKPDAWYTEAVDWASQTDIVSGTGAGFDPEGSVTREQIASILYRYAKLKGWDVSKTANLQDFADGTDTSAWATRAMEWAYAEKLITGKDGNRLDPQGQATRAEVAAILMRLLESKAEKA